MKCASLTITESHAAYLIGNRKQIQFFGARCNLAKALLLAINGGRCENTGTVMVKNIPVLTSDTLNFEEVMSNYKKVLTEIARVYNEAMNIIHYMHDKYYYEKAQMALVDTNHASTCLRCSRTFYRPRFTVGHQIC